MNIKKILFVGLSCIGDAVMTIPVLLSLHDKYPDASFDIIADKRSMDLYSTFPYLNNLYLKDKDKFFRGVPDLLHRLWKNYYDVIVDVRTDGLAYLLRGRNKYTKWSGKDYGPHAVEKIMGVIYKIHKNEKIPLTKLWLLNEHYKYAEDSLSVFTQGNVLSVCVGSDQRAQKSWPTEKFIELFERHKNDFTGLVFLGGEIDRNRTEEICSKTTMPYINIIGSNLLQGAAVLERCKIYIGADSGLGHVANAVGTNTIILFSNDIPERCLPWGDKSRGIVGSNQDARNIRVETVSEEIRKILDE